MSIETYDEDLARAAKFTNEMLDPQTPSKQVGRLALDPVFKMFPGLVERIGKERNTKRKEKLDVKVFVRSFLKRSKGS